MGNLRSFPPAAVSVHHVLRGTRFLIISPRRRCRRQSQLERPVNQVDKGPIIAKFVSTLHHPKAFPLNVLQSRSLCLSLGALHRAHGSRFIGVITSRDRASSGSFFHPFLCNWKVGYKTVLSAAKAQRYMAGSLMLKIPAVGTLDNYVSRYELNATGTKCSRRPTTPRERQADFI